MQDKHCIIHVCKKPLLLRANKCYINICREKIINIKKQMYMSKLQKQNDVFGPFIGVLKKGMLCICCVQNETKQTKCAKTFQTVWLLCDRGGEHIQEKNKGIYDKQRQTKEYTTKDKQKPPPTLCSWSQTANYKR